MRLAFMGSPAFAVPALRALVDAGHEIACVYSQPPRPAGRGHALTPCPVHQAALSLGLPVRTPARVKRDEVEHAAFAALGLDAAVVAAYGLILPPAMLDAPKRGCLNIHASLLPRWRGAAPIQAAILAGDAETGITVMCMEEGLDTGPMLLREAVAITDCTTTPELHDALADIGSRLIVRALAEQPAPVPQPDEGATYAAKLTRDDGRIDWSRDAVTLGRQVRALNPWPGTFAQFAGEALKILAATPVAGAGAPGTILAPDFTVACGDGALRLDRVQRPGRPAVAGDAFLRGIQGAAWPILT
jgi:methionyl-tRNA formyltransferase